MAKVEVILADEAHRDWLARHAAVIAEELNVKAVEFSDRPEQYVSYEVLPNFKSLGKKLGKLMPQVKPALAKENGAELLAKLKAAGQLELSLGGQQVTLTGEDVEIRMTAKPGWAAASDKGVVVVLATEITPDLAAEGLARDLVRVIQDARKEQGCEFTDRIAVGVVTESPELRGAVELFRDTICGETLATNLSLKPLPHAKSQTIRVGDADAELYLSVGT